MSYPAGINKSSKIRKINKEKNNNAKRAGGWGDNKTGIKERRMGGERKRKKKITKKQRNKENKFNAKI